MYIFLFKIFTEGRGFQFSPDCSGYAAWSVDFCSLAAAFERKAGPKICANH